VPVTMLDPVKDRLWTPEDVSAFLGGVPVSTLYNGGTKASAPRAAASAVTCVTSPKTYVPGSNSRREADGLHQRSVDPARTWAG